MTGHVATIEGRSPLRFNRLKKSFHVPINSTINIYKKNIFRRYLETIDKVDKLKATFKKSKRRIVIEIIFHFHSNIKQTMKYVL